MTEHRDTGRWSAHREKQMSLFEMFLNTVFDFTTRPRLDSTLPQPFIHSTVILFSLALFSTHVCVSL